MMDSRVLAIAWRLNQGTVLVAFFFLSPILRLAAAPPDDEAVKPLAEIPVRSRGGVFRQTFSPDGSLLATYSEWGPRPFGTFSLGKDLIVWDVATGDPKAKVADRWWGFAFSNNGSAMAVWTDQEVSILDPKTGNCLATLVHSNVRYVQFLLHAELIVTQTKSEEGFGYFVASELQFWSTKTWKRVETKIDRHMPLMCPAVSPDGKYVAGYEPAPQNVKNGEAQLKLWEVKTGRELPAPKMLPDSILRVPHLAARRSITLSSPLGLGFTHDGKVLCVFPFLWDIEASESKPVSKSFDIYRDVSWAKGSVGSASTFSILSQPSRKRVKIIEGKIFVWDSYKGKLIAEFDNPVKEHPDNDTAPNKYAWVMMKIPWIFDNALVLETRDVGASSVKTIIDPETGRILVRLRQPRLARIQFSPRGQVFATIEGEVEKVPRSTKLVHHPGNLKAERTSSLAGITLWGTRTGRKLAEFPHKASTGFFFSPDGKILASVGPDGIKLWKVSESLRDAAG